MSTAEKIYEHVKVLPEPAIREILDFVEFMARKSERPLSVSRSATDSAIHWPLIVLDYEGEPDFTPFETGRVQLIPPSGNPLA